MTKQEAIERMKQSLKIKEQMVKAADERLKQWQDEINASTTSLA